MHVMVVGIHTIYIYPHSVSSPDFESRVGRLFVAEKDGFVKVFSSVFDTTSGKVGALPRPG